MGISNSKSEHTTVMPSSVSCRSSSQQIARNNPPDSLLAKYSLGNSIQGGNFGQVFFGKTQYRPYEQVAIKKISNSRQSQLSVSSEAQILQDLDHPYIVKYVDFIQSDRESFIVTEYCPSGTIKQGTYSTSHKLVKTQVHQLLQAIQYIKSKGIIHRDIKPENVLIGRDGNIRLIDFGLAIYEKSKVNSMAGSLPYMAPEVESKVYSYECDMWSVGVLLYQLIIGQLPFQQELSRSFKLTFPENIYQLAAPECIQLIIKMLKVEPRRRISIEDALNHEWFQD